MVLKSIKKDLTPYHSKDNLKGLTAILLQYILLSVSFACTFYVVNYLAVPLVIFLYPVCALFTAGVLLGFFFLLHEATHNNLFESRTLNRKIDVFGSFLIFQDSDLYKDWHFKHHKFLGTKNDPEIELKRRWKIQGSTFFVIYVVRFFSLFYLVDFLKNEFKWYWLRKKNIAKKLVYWGILIATVCSTFGVKWFLVCYVIPVFIVYPYIHFISVVHEHITLANETKSFFKLTRNNINGFVNKYLLHRYNDGYHSLHHFDASIPFFHLPEAHKQIKKKYGIDFVEENFLYTLSETYRNEHREQ